MSRQYLVPCPSCERQITVEISQAGREIDCPGCGESVRLGTLRQIRELTPAEQLDTVPSAERRNDPWSTARRWVFVAGLAVTAVGLIWGGTTFLRVGFTSGGDLRAQQLTAAAKKVVDGLSPSEMRSYWRTLPFDSADEWKPSPYLVQRAAIAQARSLGYVGLGIAAAGLLTLLTAVAVRF